MSIIEEHRVPIVYIHKTYPLLKQIYDICKFFDFQLNPHTNGDGTLHAAEFGDQSLWMQYRFDNSNLGSIDQTDVNGIWCKLFCHDDFWIKDGMTPETHFLKLIEMCFSVMERRSHWCVSQRKPLTKKLGHYVKKLNEIASTEGFPELPDEWKGYALKQGDSA